MTLPKLVFVFVLPKRLENETRQSFSLKLLQTPYSMNTNTKVKQKFSSEYKTQEKFKLVLQLEI